MPKPPVLDAIQRAWRADRKPANVLIVLDTSGSMGNGHRLQSAKQGLEVFLDQIAPQDRVGLITFSNAPRLLVSLQRFTAAGTDLRRTIRGLGADGATATYDATARAFDILTARGSRTPRRHATSSPGSPTRPAATAMSAPRRTSSGSTATSRRSSDIGCARKPLFSS